jgi:hypothetical protein
MWMPMLSIMLLLHHFHNVGYRVAESNLMVVGIRLGVMGIVVVVGRVTIGGASALIRRAMTLRRSGKVKVKWSKVTGKVLF